ncbi:uncharacterized protein ARMOST_18129 [Armillaria ostoyae]|uniref:Uncharacterized protein n=1 Tax=Armillaria ostoyae TaxID=47428 RepID=A0A284S0X8_ARMOS|nr:uncharacterized protein ARMOST_18129 [Armillaria ostoyae]
MKTAQRDVTLKDQVLAVNDTSRAELLKGSLRARISISSPSKHEHGVSAKFRPQYLAISDKRTQNHGYANRVARPAVHPTLSNTRLSRAVQHAYSSDIVAVVCPLHMLLSAFRIPALFLPLAAVKMAKYQCSNFAVGKYTGKLVIALAAKTPFR